MAQTAIGAVEDLIHAHSYRAAKARIDAMQQWPKLSDRLRQENTAAEEQEFNNLKSRAQSLFQKQDISGLEHLQDDLQIFSAREQDPATQRAETDLDRNLNVQLTQLKKDLSGDNAAFAKAEKDFQDARGAGDVNRLETDVLREFQRIAQGNGYNRVAAEGYVNSVIPSAIKDMTQNLASKGKAVVPAISCASVQLIGDIGGKDFSCAQLGLHWIGNPTVDVPPGAKQAGKLPYTLKLILAVDGNGKIIRVEKAGAAEEPFFKKAKDAAREWKTSSPMLNGKPVKASFPIEITFQP